MRVRQTVLPFKIILSDRPQGATAHAGVPLIIETMRSVIKRVVYKALAKALGYEKWKVVRRHVESLVVLVTTGGDCIEDLNTLRADKGLATLLAFKISCPTQVKEFLYSFHQTEDGKALTPDDDAVLSQVGTASIRPEGPGLRVLAAMLNEIVRRIQAINPCRRATVDIDATIIEAHKALALKAYEGTVGYQPQMAWWAEQSVWLCDEFRDGNVPAAFGVKGFAQRAFDCVPRSVTSRRMRGDSALYDEEALTWADGEDIEFAVSADMSESLTAHTKALPESAWQPYRTIKGDMADERAATKEERQWADVPDFVPDWKRNRCKNGRPLRYVAIRVRSRQRDLLAGADSQWRHFAIVSNMWDWDGERLLRWHREKQGTVEHAHGVMKNELAGGTLPCGRFASNATWWRINTAVHDVTQLLKVQALPVEMRALRPKALRFRLFNVAGIVGTCGGRPFLRLAADLPGAKILVAAREAIFRLLVPPECPAAAPP